MVQIPADNNFHSRGVDPFAADFVDDAGFEETADPSSPIDDYPDIYADPLELLPRNEAARTDGTHTAMLASSLTTSAGPTAPDPWPLSDAAQAKFLELRSAESPEHIEAIVNSLMNDHGVPKATVADVLASERSLWSNAWHYAKNGSFTSAALGDDGAIASKFHLDGKRLGWESAETRIEGRSSDGQATARYTDKDDAWHVGVEGRHNETTDRASAEFVKRTEAGTTHEAHLDAASTGQGRRSADATYSYRGDGRTHAAGLSADVGERDKIEASYTTKHDGTEHRVDAGYRGEDADRSLTLDVKRKAEGRTSGGNLELTTGESTAVGGGLRLEGERSTLEASGSGSHKTTDQGAESEAKGSVDLTRRRGEEAADGTVRLGLSGSRRERTPATGQGETTHTGSAKVGVSGKNNSNTTLDVGGQIRSHGEHTDLRASGSVDVRTEKNTRVRAEVSGAEKESEAGTTRSATAGLRVRLPAPPPPKAPPGDKRKPKPTASEKPTTVNAGAEWKRTSPTDKDAETRATTHVDIESEHTDATGRFTTEGPGDARRRSLTTDAKHRFDLGEEGKDTLELHGSVAFKADEDPETIDSHRSETGIAWRKRTGEDTHDSASARAFLGSGKAETATREAGYSPAIIETKDESGAFAGVEAEADVDGRKLAGHVRAAATDSASVLSTSGTYRGDATDPTHTARLDLATTEADDTAVRTGYKHSRKAGSDEVELTGHTGESRELGATYRARRGKTSHRASAGISDGENTDAARVGYRHEVNGDVAGLSLAASRGAKRGGEVGVEIKDGRTALRAETRGYRSEDERGTTDDVATRVHVGVPHGRGQSAIDAQASAKTTRPLEGNATSDVRAALGATTSRDDKTIAVGLEGTSHESGDTYKRSVGARLDVTDDHVVGKDPASGEDTIEEDTASIAVGFSDARNEADERTRTFDANMAVGRRADRASASFETTRTDTPEASGTTHSIAASGERTFTLDDKGKEALTLGAYGETRFDDDPKSDATYRAGATLGWSDGSKTPTTMEAGITVGRDAVGKVATEAGLKPEMVGDDKTAAEFARVDIRGASSTRSAEAEVLTAASDNTTLGAIRGSYNEGDSAKVSILAGMAKKNDNVQALLQTTNNFVLGGNYKLDVGAELQLKPGDDGHDALWQAYAGLGVPLRRDMTLTLRMGVGDDGERLAYVPEIMFDIPKKLGVQVMGRFGSGLDASVAARVDLKTLGLGLYGGYGDPAALAHGPQGGMNIPAVDDARALSGNLGGQGYVMMTSDLLGLFRALGDL